ncbi:hypothetical protein [Brevundimonas goettingensis]|uniref:Uncharacterized protein n=1 Tax=Brevundimonas goettingensis TaxID=2774190 RepID=A0A975C659_9CAUL|nr:hypothetical protein [Brevundimonas goettingensis]QTC92700.1 hypothetical protein IFJ75_07520 [Brevundimonas goettingensis]
MSLIALISALVLGAGAAPAPVQIQQDPAAEPQVTQLPSVEALGRADQDAVRDFVGRVAAPASGRGLARWEGQVCPGAVNFQPEVAQPIVDRIADVARELDIRVGAPGCRANIVVVFTNNGPGVARTLIENDLRLFRIGVSGLDQGAAALRTFEDGDQPVRWWPLSMSFDPRTGQRAMRVPGDRGGVKVDEWVQQTICGGPCGNPDDSILGAAPVIAITGGASRVNSATEDALFKVIVIVDVARIGVVSADQLGDYLAMVSLAQIGQDAETGGFDSVLNLFDGGAQGRGLTDWDWSYLRALYGAAGARRSPASQADSVIRIMRSDRQRAEAAE